MVPIDNERRGAHSGGSLDNAAAPLAIAAVLQAGQQAGVFGAFNPLVVARSLRGAIDAIEPVLRHHPEADFAAYAAELVTMFEKVTAP